MTALLIFIAALLQVTGPAATQPAGSVGPVGPVGNVENGKKLFTANTCYYCHGTVGQGGVAGARVAQVARNAQGFIRYVRRPTGAMPAYTEKVISDQQLADIYAYLRSLPPAKAVKDIPLLTQMK